MTYFQAPLYNLDVAPDNCIFPIVSIIPGVMAIMAIMSIMPNNDNIRHNRRDSHDTIKQ